MRVVQVNKYYSPPHLGGIEVAVRRLSEGLVQHAGATVRALVCNEGHSRLEERVGAVQVIRLPTLLKLSAAPVAVGMPGELRRISDHGAAEVLNFHAPYPWGELSFLMARPDVPSVVYYHSDIVRQRRLLAVYRPFLRRFLDRVDLIMVSSPHIVRHSEFLAPYAEKCHVVPFGLPEESFAEAPARTRHAAELRRMHGGRRVVLFVGRFVYYKGVDVLVRAMADVDADLVLIGRGPLEGGVRQLAAQLGIADRITLLDRQTDEELAAWYRAADVFCLPSVARSEAFGLVQIEAHAAGTPVVSTDLPTGVPYANLDGVTGLVVPPGDSDALAHALSHLLADEELRARLGGQARLRARREFTIPRMVEQTLQVYAEAVDVHARRKGSARPR